MTQMPSGPWQKPTGGFHWRIRHKLALCLGLVVGITALLSVGSLGGLRSYRQSNKVFRCHARQLELMGRLELGVSRLNFPNDGVSAIDLDLNRARQEKLERLEVVDEVLEQYRTALDEPAGSPLPQEQLEAQRAQIVQIQDDLDQLVQLVADTRSRASAMQPKSLWWDPQERTRISQLIADLEGLRTLIQEGVAHHVEADRKAYRASLAVVYTTSVLVVLLLAGLVWLGYQAVVHPLSALHQAVSRLAKGDFECRVHVQTGDEMQELGEAFNQMADRLAAIYQDLNQQVQERSRQLIRSERLASVGFLAAGVAHEINNPLASIAFSAEALQRRLGGLLPADSDDAEVARNYLRMIQQESFRCKTITDKLLDFSRAGELERVDTDLASLIRSVIDMIQHLGRAKDKHIVYEPAASVSAHVNPHEIKQVLLNLVINGLDSVAEGGTVHIVPRRQGDWVEIEVADDGCGMPKEVLDNLFEPFFTRNRTGKGTGLGLSISHLIISQHGGTLEARSTGPDQGSTFTIRLPLAQEVQAAREAA